MDGDGGGGTGWCTVQWVDGDGGGGTGWCSSLCYLLIPLRRPHLLLPLTEVIMRAECIF